MGTTDSSFIIARQFLTILKTATAVSLACIFVLLHSSVTSTFVSGRYREGVLENAVVDNRSEIDRRVSAVVTVVEATYQYARLEVEKISGAVLTQLVS